MSGWRRSSLVFRLSLYYGLGSLAIMSAMGTYLYREHMHRFRVEHTEVLVDKAQFLRNALATMGPEILRPDALWWWREVAVVENRLHLTVTDEREQVLVALSPVRIPADALPPAAAIGQPIAETRIWHPEGGHRYRIIGAWADVGTVRPTRVLITLALEVSSDYRMRMRFGRTMFITLAVGVLLAILLGYAIARRGLAPVRRIARAANEITSTHLDDRLELADAPQELRDLALAFNAMLDRLRESFARLTQFSSDLAHELRTPINNLMGESQVALSRARDAGEYRTVLESGVEELERLSRMIENMLFLARAEHPETTVSATWLVAGAELDKVADFYAMLADESRVKISRTGDGRVWADPQLLRRAISNLLSNALRHTPAGGEVVLEVAAVAGATALTVRNPGPPIPAQDLPRIFDRFYRVEMAREGSSSSAGLGLSIVQTIMRLHGGTVEVARTEGGWTAFILRFPSPQA
ncbi:MAG: heavy metal sensor histidine kinase [Burkholderiales bacterium]